MPNTRKLNVLDLFSGIGGFSLGLERSGMQTIAFCEILPYCRAVLRKHWPGVPIFEDVRTLTAADVPGVDVICGGFPCQDISVAGKGAGIEGERSGLWREYARLIGEIRPQYVIVENVAALLGRGMGKVLGDLAEIGYDAEWNIIPAAAVGAPHQRERIWIVAHPSQLQRNGSDFYREYFKSEVSKSGNNCCSSDATNTNKQGLAKFNVSCDGGQEGERIFAWSKFERILTEGRTEQWSTEPDVGRVANGVPSRVDRLRSLGNAVVPQIPELIGRAIMQAEGIA